MLPSTFDLSIEQVRHHADGQPYAWHQQIRKRWMLAACVFALLQLATTALLIHLLLPSALTSFLRVSDWQASYAEFGEEHNVWQHDNPVSPDNMATGFMPDVPEQPVLMPDDLPSTSASAESAWMQPDFRNPESCQQTFMPLVADLIDI